MKEETNGWELSEDEYWGKWILCECGYDLNVGEADYCGRCGKKIKVIGSAKYNWQKDEYEKWRLNQ